MLKLEYRWYKCRIISGVKIDDKIKIWNKTESKKIEDNEDKGQNEEDDFDD